MKRAARIWGILGLGLLAGRVAGGATVSGGFEGSNVVDIQEASPNQFTCQLVTPPMPVPASVRYNTPGNHYHNRFMLKVEDAAGETVPMGYEVSLGAQSNNFLTNAVGVKHFGEAIVRAIHDFYGGFGATVAVSAPNGGEALPSAGSTSVAWSSTGSVANARIDCSTDGGASWTNLLSSTPNDGSQTVTLPSADSDSCLIRVSDASALGVSDLSDSAFSIGAPPPGTIAVASPNGGELWDANWMDTVAWISTGSIPHVKIEVSADNGGAWRRLAYSAPNNGSYRINVPLALSSQCRVRVTGVENSAVSDTSNATFTIQAEPPWPTLTVNSPNGGESWTPGGTETVAWGATGLVSDVGISLSTDEGASWSTLVASTPNDGSETVSAPMAASSKCLIWVYDARNDPWLSKPDADPLDVSAALFAIGAPSSRVRAWQLY